MKYIDSEKLIAEIERLKEETPIGICEYDKGEENGRYEVLNHLLSTITSLQQEQPEVDYNKFEKLFYDFCERNKGHHITSHDACMWFWGLGLNARKEE